MEGDTRFVDPHSLYRCSEYGLLAVLTVCTERPFRQLPSTVRNSAAVLEMTNNARQFFYLNGSTKPNDSVLIVVLSL